MDGRFAVVQSPDKYPGQCRICGSATKSPLLDLQYIEDYYGSIYYCMECFNEMAELLGFMSPEKVVKLRAQLREEQETSTALAVQLVNFTKLEDAIENAGYVHSDSISTVDISIASILTSEAVSEDAFSFYANVIKDDGQGTELSRPVTIENVGTVLTVASLESKLAGPKAKPKPGI